MKYHWFLVIFWKGQQDNEGESEGYIEMIPMQKEAHSLSPLSAADTDASEGSS